MSPQLDGFSRNIKALREDKGLTQYELAEHLGLTSASVSFWENKGSKPHKREVVAKMCELFGVSESELFGYADGYYAKTRGAGSAARYSRVSPSDTYLRAEEGKQFWCPPELFEEGCFAIEVTDSSMGNIMPKGSVAIVKPNNAQPSKPVIGYVAIGDALPVFRRVRPLGDGIIVLEPDSPDSSYRRSVVDTTDPDAPRIRFIGQVAYVGKEFS